MAIKILHLADVHLGAANSYLEDKAQTRSDDFRATFRDALESALDPEARIRAVLIAGDLFDGHRPAAEVFGFAKGLLTRLAASGVAVVMIPGSHDAYGYRDSVYRTERFPGVDLITVPNPAAPIVREIDGVRVHFYGMAHVPGVTASPFTGFTRVATPGLHIGLLHGCVTAGDGTARTGALLEIPRSAIASSGLDYLALGGRHDREIVTAGQSFAAYPGCLEGRGFFAGEFGRKGYLEVEVEPGLAPRITERPVSRRTIMDLTVDLPSETITDAAALQCAILARSGEDRIARITLSGSKEFLVSREEIHARVAGSFYHVEVVDRARVADSTLIARIRGENTIRGIFVRKMLAKIEAAKARASRNGHDSGVEKEIRILETALKVGVEQFVDEDAITPIFAPAGGTAGSEERLRARTGELDPGSLPAEPDGGVPESIRDRMQPAARRVAVAANGRSNGNGHGDGNGNGHAIAVEAGQDAEAV